ncbi:MAG: hypothetical protein IJ304_03000 [Clostridia bacterium]|nr:hypothetical protein [Clostridia bacterium]
MWNAFKAMWKNVFNYSGTVGVKEFWLACVAEVIFMYFLLVPLAIIIIPLQLIGIPIIISAELFSALYICVCLVPLISLYARRMNDVGLTKGGIIYVAITIPIVAAMITSTFPSESMKGCKLPWFGHFIIVGMGMGIYASIFYAFFPVVSGLLMGTGLVLASIPIVIGAFFVIKNIIIEIFFK